MAPLNQWPRGHLILALSSGSSVDLILKVLLTRSILGWRPAAS